MGSSPKVITAAELARHNTEKDCWLAVSGKVYDVTKFVPMHPGGKDFILVSAGRDATHLIQSYHPFTDAPYKMIQKYYIGDLAPDDDSHFVGPNKHKEFYGTCAKRVNDYFKKNNIDHKWSNELIWRSLFIYLGSAIGFFIANFTTADWGVRLACAIMHGMAQALFGLQIMHDSSHASLTHSPKVWKIIGSTWDLVSGASFYAWVNQHSLGHHVYTNVAGKDPDICSENFDEAEFRRIAPQQKYYSYYRFQHIYTFLLYPLLAIKVRIGDSISNITLINGQIKMNPSTYWWLVFLAGKAIFLVVRVILPLLYSPHSVWQLLGIFMITEAITGGWLAFNFQVSHVAEDLAMFDHNDPTSFTNDWAVLQVITAQDYGHGNRIWTYLCGSLNYQIEHHLFPTVNQTHYHRIAPIVMQTCKEFDIPYKCLPSFRQALFSHIKYVAKMSHRKTH